MVVVLFVPATMIRAEQDASVVPLSVHVSVSVTIAAENGVVFVAIYDAAFSVIVASCVAGLRIQFAGHRE